MAEDEKFLQVSLLIVYLSLCYNFYQIIAQYLCSTEDVGKSRVGRKKPNYLQPKLQRSTLLKAADFNSTGNSGECMDVPAKKTVE